MDGMKRALAPLAALLLVTSCAGEGEAEPTPTVTETVAATPEPAPTVTETVTATPEPEESETAEASSDDAGLTSEVQEISGDAGEWVMEVVEQSPGQFEILTMLIDPRGEDGSRDAQDAVAICEAVQEELAATHIRVMESDETTFAMIDQATGECAEV